MALCHSDSSPHRPKRDRDSAARLHACAPLLVIAALLALGGGGGPALSSWPSFRLLPVSAACDSNVQEGKWVIAPCDGDKSALFSTCSAPRPGYSDLVVGVCEPGDPASSRGLDTRITSCGQPVSGEFVTRVCDTGSYNQLGTDTEKKNCTAGASVGAFVSVACTAGYSNALGSDMQESRCTLPTPSQYIVRACKPGSRAAVGYDSTISEPPRPPSGQRVVFEVKATLLFTFPRDTLMSSPELEKVVRRAVDRQLDGGFDVRASATFTSLGSFSVELLVNTTSSAGVTAIVGTIDLMDRMSMRELAMWRQFAWPDQQAPIEARFNYDYGVSNTVADFVDEPPSFGRHAALIGAVAGAATALILIIMAIYRCLPPSTKESASSATEQKPQSKFQQLLGRAWLPVRRLASACRSTITGVADPQHSKLVEL